MHGHNHNHRHGGTDHTRAFAVGVGLNVIYIVVEVAYGLATSSLALLADAGHNLSDVLALLIAWGAIWLGKKKPTERYTYGWRGASILAALANAIILLVAVGGIAWEAINRFGEPVSVSGGTVAAVALVGVVINAATALMFMRGRHADLNIRGAFLHMAADTAVSLGVVLGGLGMRQFGWTWLDPVLSLVIACVILIGTWELFMDSARLAIHAVPKQIDPDEVRAYLRTLSDVTDVHDLHIWPLSTTETALTAHLVKPQVADEDEFLIMLSRQLRERFNIDHATIQIERSRGIVECHLHGETAFAACDVDERM